MFSTFANQWGFTHQTSSPRHPQSNGKVEATVKCMKKLLAASWDHHHLNDNNCVELFSNIVTPHLAGMAFTGSKTIWSPCSGHRSSPPPLILTRVVMFCTGSRSTSSSQALSIGNIFQYPHAFTRRPRDRINSGTAKHTNQALGHLWENHGYRTQLKISHKNKEYASPCVEPRFP